MRFKIDKEFGIVLLRDNRGRIRGHGRFDGYMIRIKWDSVYGRESYKLEDFKESISDGLYEVYYKL